MENERMALPAAALTDVIRDFQQRKPENGEPDQHFVVCLAGPTGAGKTALSLAIAGKLGGEVVNADSRQVYRDFPIITAQPTPEEQMVCPHHLYAYLATGERTDTGDWSERALSRIKEIESRGHLPLLVGGTGFYFQTLLHGIAAIPPVPEDLHQELIARAHRDGIAQAYAELEKKDPVTAARLHPNDRQRILRALEVTLATGSPLSWWHANATAKAPCRGPLFVLDTPLASLEPVLRRRIDLMLDAGALDEARRALELCPDATAPGWSGIGCREVLGYLRGTTDFDTMVTLWYKNTRAYAKRQITWFKGRKEAIWVNPAS